jgi:hypothetical protein
VAVGGALPLGVAVAGVLPLARPIAFPLQKGIQNHLNPWYTPRVRMPFARVRMPFASPGSGSVVEHEEMAPVPRSMQKVAAVANEAVANKGGGESGGDDLPDDGGYDSPPEEEDQGSEKEEEDVAVINRIEEDDDNSMTSEAKKSIFVGTHHLEEGHLASYAKGKGIFTGRKCFICRARFVDGKVFLEGPYTWKIGSGPMMACHCMTCNICLCMKCLPDQATKTPPRRPVHPPKWGSP